MPIISLITGLITSSLLFFYLYSNVVASCHNATTPRVVRGFTTTFSFTNSTGLQSEFGCIQGSPALIQLKDGKIDLSTYKSIKTEYYDKAPAGIKNPASPPPFTLLGSLNGGTVYNIGGDAYVNPPAANLSINGSGPVIVFVDKDLYIQTDITAGKTSNTQGLVFIVQGEILINHAVKEINAVLVSEGLVNSSSDPNRDPSRTNLTSRYPICSTYNDPSCEAILPFSEQLIINGNFIHIYDQSRIYSAKRMELKRDLQGSPTSNTVAAEEVILQPKYFVILKDLFGPSQVSIQEVN